jgi:chromosome segregation ATPase
LSLKIAKHNELERLQRKVEYLRNEVNMLENEKWKSTNQILKLNRMKDEFEGSLSQKRGEMAYLNQETAWYDNTDIPYSEPEISSYFIRLSYAAMDDLLG